MPKFKTLAWFVSLSCILGVLFGLPSAQASEDATNLVTKNITGRISALNKDIWTGDVPTSVSIPESYAGAGYPCGKVKFPIKGLLPTSELLNRAAGVNVEFQVWSAGGAKIANTTISSYNWNPVGPLTEVSIQFCDKNSYGDHTMLILTQYELSTTGLLTRYLEEKTTLPFSVIKPVAVPSAPVNQKGSWVGNEIEYTFSAPTSEAPILYYEVGLAESKSGSTETNRSFNAPVVLKQVTNTTFRVTAEEFTKANSLNGLMTLVQVRAVNSGGAGAWSSGIYTLTKQIQDAYVASSRVKLNLFFTELPTSRQLTCGTNSLTPADISKFSLLGTYWEITNSKGEFIDQFAIKADNTPRRIERQNGVIVVTAEPDSNIYYFMGNYKKGEKYFCSVSPAQTNDLLMAAVSASFSPTASFSSGKIVTEVTVNPTASKTSILCKKGSIQKKVTSISPKCPTGYKKIS